MDNGRTRLPDAVRWFVVVVVAILPVSMLTASGYEAGTPPPPRDPEVTSRPPDSAVIRKPGRDKGFESDYAGLQSSLAAFIEQPDLSEHVRTENLTTSGYEVKDGRVQVQIIIDPLQVDRVTAVIEHLGGEITAVNQPEDRLQGWIPLSSLVQVNDITGVHKVRRPAYVHPADVLSSGNSTTEGVSEMNAAAWHAAGITGDGVKVGIIDTGFLDFPTLLGTDLPASVTVKNFVDGETDPQVDGTSLHGTAIAEIVHDVAPGAELYFAKVSTDLDFQDAMLWLKDTHHVDVISTSLTYFNISPGDGTGEFADWVDQARTAGIFWATAAGNYRQNHWGGSFSDTDGDDYHNFGIFNETCLGPLGDCYLLTAGDPISIFLRWDDWSSVTQDYDLVLWRKTDTGTWTKFAVSEDFQTGAPGQTPTEAIFTTAAGSDAYYLPAVYKYASTRDVDFELTSYEWPLEYQVYARSIAGLADVPGAMTVAALDVLPPYLQETYSSEGPTNGPGGTAGGGFIKPDIAAFVNVSTESYGPWGFAGTSAATPHVAGAAALIKSANPSFTPDQIQTYLETNAVDMGPPGMDTSYGYGRLLLLDPPNYLYLPLIMR